MAKTKLLILYFFTGIIILNAQEYEIKSLPINNNGGSNSIKNKIVFDEDGVLWYNTLNGMVKEFESSHIFYPFLDGKDTVPVQKTNDILLDKKGRIWVTTEEGVFRSDASKESFQKLHWDIFANVKHYPVLMAEDCHGNVWMAISKTQVLKISSDTEFKVFEVAEVAPEDQDKHLHVVNIYHCDIVVMQRGLSCFIINQDTSQFSEIPIQFRLKDSEYKMDFEVIENGDVFPEDFEGIYIYNGIKFKVFTLETSNLQVIEIPSEMARISRVKNPILKERMDFVFFGFGDDSERKFEFLKLVKDNDEYHLKSIEEISFDYIVESFEIAHNGVVYVSVFDQIYKIRFKNKGFKKALYNQKKQGEKLNVSTRGFLEVTDQEFLVATYEGFFKLSLSPSNDSISESIVFSDFNLYRAYAKVNDSIALAVGESAILKINYKKNRAIVKSSGKDFGEVIFYDIIKYTDTTCLLASDIGIAICNIENGTLKPYKIFPLGSDTAKFVRDINYHKNTLYFSTQTDGLFIQNTITNEVSNIVYQEGGKGLPSNYVYTSFIDSNDNLWVGTNKGLACYNKEQKKRFVLNKQDGLLDENIVGIQQDILGNIWFSTYKGLYKYNPKLKTVFSYFKEDGLTDNEFNQNSYHTATNGTLFFGGVNGVVAFDTIAENTTAGIKILPINVEYFDSKKNRDTTMTDIVETENYIRLDTKNSSISITFSINDFFNIENNRYLYKVEGLSDEWENLGSQNTLKLFSIPPGKYTINVKGLNSKGISSSNELLYSIYVPQVWYKTTWFILVCIALVVGVFISITISYTIKQKKKHRLNLMLIELEQKALRAQMNPHFIFNTLNGMHKKLMKSTSEEVEDYIVSFSEFLRHTLDIGRRELILLSKEIQYIKSYIDLINHGNNDSITLKVQCNANVNQKEIKIPSMIIQPIVENAVVHGFPKNKTDKQIHLVIEKNHETKQLEVEIRDNGIGVKASLAKRKDMIKSHQSYATQIVNERFELLNKTQKSSTSQYELLVEDITNETRSGTCVTVKIPYS